MASGVVADRESHEYITYLEGQMAAAKGDSNSTTARGTNIQSGREKAKQLTGEIVNQSG